MQEIGSLCVFVQGAGFILLDPDTDQLARQIMPLGKPVKALPGNVLLNDLPLELDAVRTLSGHGFHLSKAQLILSNYSLQPVRFQGRTPDVCPLWVISRHMWCKRACPLYPQ